MGRDSRIRHPEHNWVKGHRWVAREFGRAVAFVLGEIEFLDRPQPEAGLRVATRAQLIAALEGFIGRDAVDEAIQILADLGWIRIHEVCRPGTNLTSHHMFSLDAGAIEEWLANRGISRFPENRKPGSESGFPDGKQDEKTNPTRQKKQLLENNNNVVVFLEAAGPAGKDLSLGAVSRALGNATELQARWAGLALKEQAEDADDPARLAIALARLAAAGDVGKPRTILKEEREKKRKEAAEAYRKQLRDVAASVQPPAVRNGDKLPRLPRALGGRR